MAHHPLQHHLKSLHLMAKAMCLGLTRGVALSLARGWERYLHPVQNPDYPSLRPIRVRSFVRVAPRSPLFR